MALTLTGYAWSAQEPEANEVLIDPIARIRHAAQTFRDAGPAHFQRGDTTRLSEIADMLDEMADDAEAIHAAMVEKMGERTPLADWHDARRKTERDMGWAA